MLAPFTRSRAVLGVRGRRALHLEAMAKCTDVEAAFHRELLEAGQGFLPDEVGDNTNAQVGLELTRCSQKPLIALSFATCSCCGAWARFGRSRKARVGSG